MAPDDTAGVSNISASNKNTNRTGFSWNRRNNKSVNAPSSLYMPQQSTGQPGSRKNGVKINMRTKTVTPKQLKLTSNWKTIEPCSINSAFI